MKIAITADAYAITSSIKASDVETLKKHNPDALSIKDDDGNDIFTVNYSEGNPNISRFGITFGGISRDNKKVLTLTGTIPGGVADAKEFVTDKVAPVMENLSELETKIPEAAKKVAETRKAIMDTISEN